MKAILFYAVLVFAWASGEEEKQICTPGAWFKVECKNCSCSEDGTVLACSESQCPAGKPTQGSNLNDIFDPPNSSLPQQYGEHQICQPGTTRKWDCNNCRCSSDGTAEACTRRLCPKVPRLKRDLPLRCVPGSTFMDDCNRCFCSSDGRLAGCTLMLCPEKILGTTPKVELVQIDGNSSSI